MLIVASVLAAIYLAGAALVLRSLLFHRDWTEDESGELHELPDGR